jgi:hypothetical protein
MTKHSKHIKNALLIVCCSLSLFALAFLFLGSRNRSPNMNEGRLRSQPRKKVAGGNATPDAASLNALAEPDSATRARIVDTYGSLPMSFEANQGQTDSHVKFVSRGTGYKLFLTSTEAVVALARRNDPRESRTGKIPSFRMTKAHTAAERTEGTKTTVLRMGLVSANPSAQMVGHGELPGKTNYFIGNDPKKWQTDVPTYARVQYKDVYPGVDLAYYGNQRQLEYDFIVTPGADPNQIRMEFEGADRIRLDSAGDLVLTMGGHRVTQRRPFAYQEVSGNRTEIEASYVFLSHGGIGFQIGSYDTLRPLVIDPTFIYSTYLGGDGGNGDIGWNIAVDSQGNAYVAGYTESTNFPTDNANQALFGGGGTDGFVTKLSPSGEIIYSTYLGGNGDDSCQGIAIDSAGSAYVTGGTRSTNFPTLNPFQATFGGGYADVIVTKLETDGQIEYSSYFGGSGTDQGNGIAVDSADNIYLSGNTDSNDFPTLNAIQPSHSNDGGFFDIFVTKFSLRNGISYSTYIGGTGGELAGDIAIDPAGNAYVAGSTTSTDYPTLNAFQSTRHSGGDAFITKLTATGELAYSTYLGGSGGETCQDIAVDAAGNAYVSGQTGSNDFPTQNAAQSTIAASFVTKLSPTGMVSYSTYLGNRNQILGEGIAVDGAGNAYVTGGYKVSIYVLNSQGQLAYSTIIGEGRGTDIGNRIAVDSLNNVYVTGYVSSTNFPTVNAFQPSKPRSSSEQYSAFVLKTAPLICTSNLSVTSPANVNVSTGSGESSCGAVVADADLGSATTSDNCSGTVSVTRTGIPAGNLFPVGSTTINYTATDARGNSATATQTVVVHDTTAPIPNLASLPTVTGECSASIASPPTATDNCAGTIMATTTDPTSYTTQGTFTVHWTYNDGNGNTATQIQTVVVHDTTAPALNAPPDVTLTTGNGAASCSTVVSEATLGSATATDNCGLQSLVRSGLPTSNVFAVGTTVITYTATDVHGLVTTGTQRVRVVDNTKPILNVPANMTIATAAEATSCTAFVANSLLTATASDNCAIDGASFTRTGVPVGNNFPVGSTIVTYTVKDTYGNLSMGTQTVTVTDATLPVITLDGRTITLWPPDHKYVTVKITDLVASASDNCDSAIDLSRVVISQVTSDEPENINSGDGNTLNDMVIATDCKSVDLRAERDGSKNGRVYWIYFQVKDAAGNVQTVKAKVGVPQSEGPNGAAVDDTPILPAQPPYKVLGSCSPLAAILFSGVGWTSQLQPQRTFAPWPEAPGVQ